MSRPRRRIGAVLRALVSAALLLAVFAGLDASAIAARIHGLSLPWLFSAMAISVVQFVLSAERWRRTAAHLDVPLARRRALADYYLAGFGNQVLPGGVLGDAARAWRHSRSSGRAGPAVRAVVLERLSGQLAIAVAVAAVVLLSEPGERLLERAPDAGWTTPALVPVLTGAALVLALTAAALLLRTPAIPGWLRSLLGDARRALLARSAWPGQLLLSLGVLATYCLIFASAGKMIGAEMPFPTLALVAPAVLLAMLLPVSVGGWGVREVAAAGVWTALGLPAAEGVAVSIAYGALCLVASLPGAAIAVRDAVTRPRSPRQREGRDRTARRRRG